MRHSILMFALAMAPLSACGGEEEPEAPVVDEAPSPESEPEQEEQLAGGDVNPAEIPPSEEELPIAEDFEDEASETITADNYGGALDELEAELAGEE